MGFKSFLRVSLLLLAMATTVAAQYGQVSAPPPAVPVGPTPPGQGTYAYPGAAQSPLPAPQPQAYSDMNSPDWPSYPYPPYHNPYYEGASPRDFFAGTLDWLLSLPSNVFDRFSNFVDGRFFPQTPATQGAANQTGVPAGPGQGFGSGQPPVQPIAPAVPSGR